MVEEAGGAFPAFKVTTICWVIVLPEVVVPVVPLGVVCADEALAGDELLVVVEATFASHLEACFSTGAVEVDPPLVSAAGCP